MLFFLFSNSKIVAQEVFTLNGVITDASNNETLIGVNFIVPEAQTGVVTNDYGFYSIKLPEGEYRIEISYLGYQSIVRTIQLDTDKKLDFQLQESSESL